MNSPRPSKINQSLVEARASSEEVGQHSKREFYEAKGNLFFQQQQFDKAVENYRLALEVSPNAGLYLQLARIFKQQRKEKAYLEARYEALLLDPDLSVAEDNQHLLKTLEHYYQQALQNQPEDGELHAKLAGLYNQQGKTEKAIDHYQKAIDLEPTFVHAHVQLANVQSRQRQWSEAIAHYQEALTEKGPMLTTQARKQVLKALGQAYLEMGKQLKSQGKIEETVRAYLQAVHHYPRLFEVYNRLRYNLMRYDIEDHAPLLQEIVSTCEENIKQFPDLRAAHIALGYALKKQGKRTSSEECFRTICDRTIREQYPNSEMWERAERRAPDYIVIGAEKSGTSSLYHYLCRHPAILPPIEKEMDFFDLEYEQGLDWYLAHFPPMPQASGWVTGETSANYLYSQEAPQRIAQEFPEVKLIVILRNPIERTVSRYNMMVRNGAEKRTFEAAIQQEIQHLTQAMSGDDIRKQALNRNRHLGNSLYYYHLKHWLACFPREQLLIIQSEDLFQHPDETLRKLYGELGLTHNPEQEYLKYNEGKYEPIAPKIHQTLADFLIPSVRKLEGLLGRSFDWKIVREQECQKKASKTVKPEKPVMDTGSGYQGKDHEIVDYKLWQLDTAQTTFTLRGPSPDLSTEQDYIASLGAAFTFGRFVPHPYPELLAEALNLGSLNLGFAGIGPSFFNDPKHSGLMDWINRSKFATLLVFSGRSQANSRFTTTDYSQEQYILENGKTVPADFAYQQLLNTATSEEILELVQETRERYLQEFSTLLSRIKVPKILVWFSTREPDYQESPQTLFKLLSNFPHLVNRPMIEQLRSKCEAYVEYSGNDGLPQPLINRFTGQATTIVRPRNYRAGKIELASSTLTQNQYYPSPEMHKALTDLLIPECQPFL